MAIVSVHPTGTIVRRESKDEIQRSIRRAEFEKRKRCLSILNIKMDTSLHIYSMGITEAIKKFRNDKKRI
jgi:hypothetical protein